MPNAKRGGLEGCFPRTVRSFIEEMTPLMFHGLQEKYSTEILRGHSEFHSYYPRLADAPGDPDKYTLRYESLSEI